MSLKHLLQKLDLMSREKTTEVSVAKMEEIIDLETGHLQVLLAPDMLFFQ